MPRRPRNDSRQARDARRSKGRTAAVAKRPDKESKFMETARERFQQGYDGDEKQRAREIEDLQFAAGGEGQWDPGAIAARKGNDGSNGQPKVPDRPMITINQTLEPLNQLLAQMSDSELGFELVPADDFADLIGDIDDTEIKIREGLARRIQRDSQAIEARLWAADRGNQCGRGYWAVLTRFVEGKSFDQEIYIHKYLDQFAITLDPNRTHFDGSDAEWGFVGHDMPWDEYVAEWGEVAAEDNETRTNDVVGASDDEFRALGEDYPGWFSSEGSARSCRVVDYFYTVREKRVLARMPDDSAEWFDELTEEEQKTITAENKRDVVQKKIKWAKIDGYQKLEDETDWPSPWIPIVEYVARMLQPFDDERRCEGIVRQMMGSGKGLNWMVTRMVEIIGYAPIASFMMASGQDEGYEHEYDGYSLHTFSRFHYNQTDDMGRPAPPPFRPPSNTDVAPVANAIATFKDGLQQTSMQHAVSQGEPDPAIRNAKMINAITANDQRGDSNFIGHWAQSIRHEGRIINSLLYPIYGTRPGRLASIIDGQTNQPMTVMLNRPFTTQGSGPFAKPVPAMEGDPTAQHFKLTADANFNVVVKVTKSYETRRQEEADQLAQIIGSDPQHGLSVFGDLFFKNQDGPGHQEMAERAKIMLAPQIQQALAAKAKGADIPAPVQAMIQQGQQKIAEQQAIIDEAQKIIQSKQIEGQTQLQREKMSVDKDILIAQMNNAAKIEIARITAAKQAADPGAESDEELLATGLQHAQENFNAEKDRQHDIDMENLKHANTLAQGQADTQNAAALADQAHGQAMTQAAQSAALQPQPAAPSEPTASEGNA